MTSITMPQLGESVAEGTIGKWLKQPGERIERDEPLVEVITDKVTAEIPSPVSGVVEQIVVGEGETVPVGREIAVIGDGSAQPVAAPEAPTGQAGGAQREANPPMLEGGEAEGPAIAQSTGGQGGPTGMGMGSGLRSDDFSVLGTGASVAQDSAAGAQGDDAADGEPRRASPLVRRLAREHNVDLQQVRGSGSGGRVTKDDILAYIESRGPIATAVATPSPAAVSAPSAPAPVPSVAPAAPSPAAGPDEEYLPLSPMRRMIAEHMVRSRQTTPDAWSLTEVDATPLVRLRESLLASWQQREGFELTFLPFFIKAVVESLREHPILNASWGEERIVLKKRINVGIAVAVPDGLVVPVIHDADQKSIAGLAHAVRDLAVRARANKLSLSDVQGGTFTVNNTGALGSIMSQPIINQPQAAIVTMESIVKRPVVLPPDDAIAVRSMLNVCLSFDHRVLDGAAALRFLQSIKRRIEAYGPGASVY
jgi:2-oxoisovalerate dehydrogenase E2 component (dihydrolipoyl transacylase)